jgi:MFS family permease
MAEADDQIAPPTDEAAISPGRVKPLGSFAFYEFRLVLISFTVGFVGFQMRQVTNLWLIYDITNSPLSLGLLGVFQFAPMLFLVFIGGSVADMMDRRILLILTQVGNLILAAVLAALTLTGNIEVWHIYATTFVTAMVNTFEGPARMAMLPRLVPRSHLMNAITLNQAARHSSMLIGPAFGGLMIGVVGPGWTYSLVALVFIPTMGALFLLKPMPPDPEARRRGMDRRSMLEGFRFVFSSHIILAMLLLDVVAMLFTHHRGLVPIFAEDILQVGEFGFGVMLSAPAAGFLIGSAALLIAGDVKRKGLVVIGTFVVYLVAISIFAASRTYWLSLVALAFVGGLDGVGAIMRSTILQMAVPDEIRGRTTAVLQLSNRGGPSMGQVLLGATAAAITAPNALLVGATVAGVVLVIVLLSVKGLLSYQGELAPRN